MTARVVEFRSVLYTLNGLEAAKAYSIYPSASFNSHLDSSLNVSCVPLK